MTTNSISQSLRIVVDGFRLGMEAAGSDVLIGVTEQLASEISSWPEREIQALNPWLEKLFTAQAQKNFLYVADILEYQVLPLFAGQNKTEKGDQG